jgi:hypothetical protein
MPVTLTGESTCRRQRLDDDDRNVRMDGTPDRKVVFDRIAGGVVASRLRLPDLDRRRVDRIGGEPGALEVLAQIGNESRVVQSQLHPPQSYLRRPGRV